MPTANLIVFLTANLIKLPANFTVLLTANLIMVKLRKHLFINILFYQIIFMNTTSVWTVSHKFIVLHKLYVYMKYSFNKYCLHLQKKH